MGGLYQIRESAVFTQDLLVVLAGMLLDWLWRARGMPRCVEDLTPELMSTLMGRSVLSVGRRADMVKAMEGDVTGLGAGGTGTCRAWLELDHPGGERTNVFVKVPATTVLERLFLTVFKVYPNETHFYMNVHRNEHCPADLFSRTFHASKRGHSFCIVLEDLSHRGARFPGILDAHPREQLELTLRSFARLHAAFYGRPPQGVWCDEWSKGRTVPPTARATRPAFRRIVCDHTTKSFERRYAGIIPRDLLEAYRRFCANFEAVRKIWSTGKITMCHGDGHVGNMFFTKDSCGFFDMQCITAEHPMRDVTYHCMSGYDKDALQRDEKEIVRHYCELLNTRLRERGVLEELTFEEAWEQYRLQSWWAMAAFVISAGASDLMVAETAIGTCDRICTAMMRIDAIGALNKALG